MSAPVDQAVMTVERVDCGATTGWALWYTLTALETGKGQRAVVLERFEPPPTHWDGGVLVLEEVDCATVFNWRPELVQIEGCTPP